jgi:hypothetical protein
MSRLAAMGSRLAPGATAALLAVILAGASVAAAAHPAKRRSSGKRAPIVFGIYPGGAAGTVGPGGRTIAEDPELRLAALEQLRGHRPFVLHLYDAYTRPADAEAVPAELAAQIAAYTAAGFGIELVLTYRPAAAAGDVDGFTGFVRARVRQLAANARVVGLQVTNEANVAGAPDAADGAYPGAKDALVRGVIAAKAQARRRRGGARLKIGFNWAYQHGPAEAAFFSYLRAAGGRGFARSVDWVGVDAYPGTWGPELAPGDLAAAVRAATIDAMRTLRESLLPRAGLSRAALHFSESGYPTGPGRTEEDQQRVMRATVQAIADARETYGVTDYRWFDLRDADSAGDSFESRYGITRDDYGAKAAFFTYRDLIARLG